MNTGHPWILFIIMKSPVVLDHVVLDAQFSSEKSKLDGLNPGWISLIIKTWKKSRAKHDALLNNFEMPVCLKEKSFFPHSFLP